jgi:hypothetical protein
MGQLLYLPAHLTQLRLAQVVLVFPAHQIQLETMGIIL